MAAVNREKRANSFRRFFRPEAERGIRPGGRIKPAQKCIQVQPAKPASFTSCLLCTGNPKLRVSNDKATHPPGGNSKLKSRREISHVEAFSVRIVLEKEKIV